MGNLHRFDLASMTKDFGLKGFVETGTYRCAGLRNAAHFDFEKIVSIDINEEWINRAREVEEQDPRITLLLGSSHSMLPKAVEIVGDRPTLWWLDAHLPEACSDTSDQHIHGRLVYGGNKEFDGKSTFPLEAELDVIVNSGRDFSNDVMLMDDLRIYESGAFTWGNWDSEEKKLYDAPRSGNFIDDLLRKTHDVFRDLRDHGYAVALPKRKEHGYARGDIL